MSDIKDEFWNSKHSVNDPYWLSDSNPTTVYNELGILDYIKSDEIKNVMEIGVGTGGSAKCMSEYNKKLTCVDISEIALNKVIDYSEHRYLQSEINNISDNYYDLIFSYLVFQHCNDVELYRYFDMAHRSLKDGGSFVFQIAVTIDNNIGQDYLNRESMGVEFCNRNIKDIIENLTKFNIVTNTSPVLMCNKNNIYWSYITCIK